jgi:hypothetical protein
MQRSVAVVDACFKQQQEQQHTAAGVDACSKQQQQQQQEHQ